MRFLDTLSSYLPSLIVHQLVENEEVRLRFVGVVQGLNFDLTPTCNFPNDLPLRRQQTRRFVKPMIPCASSVMCPASLPYRRPWSTLVRGQKVSRGGGGTAFLVLVEW
jgi:hypothetical protein